MYTFNRVIKDEKNISSRRREVVVEYIDGEKTLEKDLSFKIEATDLEVKRAFKQFLDEINFVPSPITDLTYTEPEPITLDAEELAFQEWSSNLQKLAAANVAVSFGLELATEAQLNTLRTKVQAGMVKTDERYISALTQYGSRI